MAMKKSYYTVAGEILGEASVSGRLDYLPDALGSVVGTLNQAGDIQSTARYKPYGGTLVSTGTRPAFGWVGTLGYRRTEVSRAEYYVRARHYGGVEGRWRSVDPLWPKEASYSYVHNNPTRWRDRLGLSADCYVRNCRMYNLNGGWLDVLIPYHAYVCAQSPQRNCKGGLPGNSGHAEKDNPCNTTVWKDKAGDWVYVECQTLTTDCGLASLACTCINKTLRRRPPPYTFPTHVCYDFHDDVRECVCKALGMPPAKCVLQFKVHDDMWYWER